MKKYINEVLNFIRQEYKFIIFLVLLYCILEMNVNYYIITGGGISNISSRVEVEDKYESQGSFNLSYVTELAKSNVMGYLLSYVMPGWERENANSYKYYDEETLRDLSIRSEIDLRNSIGNATYWAYTLAEKQLTIASTGIYVYSSVPEYNNDLKVGDKLLSIDGHPYETIDEYKAYLQEKNINDTVMIKVLRNGKEKDIETLVSKDKENNVVGVYLQVVKTYETDPKLEIKFKRTESGPSAGLMTTLEIYNQLTEKDLTNGLKIAGTGTIEEDGSIGQIGGIEHKLLGAAHSKVDIFLCPSGKNYEDALKYKKEKKLKIKIIEVKTLEETIQILEELK